MKKLISTTLAAVLCGGAVAAYAQDATSKDGMTPKTGMPAKDATPMRDATTAKDGMPMRDGTGSKDGSGMKSGMDMKSMDSNSDGMISKEEFMKHHEAMFDKMKKASNGSISVKDMEAMHVGAMRKP